MREENLGSELTEFAVDWPDARLSSVERNCLWDIAEEFFTVICKQQENKERKRKRAPSLACFCSRRWEQKVPCQRGVVNKEDTIATVNGTPFGSLGAVCVGQAISRAGQTRRPGQRLGEKRRRKRKQASGAGASGQNRRWSSLALIGANTMEEAHRDSHERWIAQRGDPMLRRSVVPAGGGSAGVG